MAYFDLSKINLTKANVLEAFESLTATITEVIKWHRGPHATKMSK